MAEITIFFVKKLLTPLIIILVPVVTFDRTFFCVVGKFPASSSVNSFIEMLKSQTNSKSPIALLFLISCLVISTLVMVSNYFFRPGLESNLKSRVISTLHSHHILNAVIDVKGRDVILKGITPNSSEAKKIETDIQNIAGVHQLHSKLLIENKTNNNERFQNEQKHSN